MRLLYYLMPRCIKTQSFVSKFMLSASGLSLKGFERNSPVSITSMIAGGRWGCWPGWKSEKSGLCKWLSAVEKPQQKGIKADKYLRAVKRGRIWGWEEKLRTLHAGIMKQPVPTEARRQMTKAETKWWCGFWRAQNHLQTFNMPLQSVCMLSLWVSKCLVSLSAFLWEPCTQRVGSGFISQGLN